MAKKLVIVESPSKSKTIGKYLGLDYKVVSSKGHIRDLATTGKYGLGVDVENEFQPNYIPPLALSGTQAGYGQRHPHRQQDPMQHRLGGYGTIRSRP